MKAIHKNIRETTLKLDFQPASLLEKNKLPNPRISIFESRPTDESKIRGGIFIVQEIFGVNSHIRAVARQYAEMGYVAWAVGYFDHIEPGIELGYTEKDMPLAMDYKTRIGWDVPLRDDELAAEMMRKSLPAAHNKIALVGYCWGGSMAWLTASRQSQIFAATIGYYGGNILSFTDDVPKAPILLHFGRKDGHIPADKVEELAKKHPTIPVYLYDADHGFNCNMRGSFDEAASELALERTKEFLKKNIG